MEPEELLRIDTPEQIVLELRIAGIGSRFLAAAVDSVLQVVLLVAGTVALTLGMSNPTLLLTFIGPPLAILFAFVVYWGYFAFFEILWTGQTPGKRIAGIRVIATSGRPIAWHEAIARNVVRTIDFLPALYGVGIITMMLNRHARRVGDYVAGTVVVYDTQTSERLFRWNSALSDDAIKGSLAHLRREELELIEAYLRRRGDLSVPVRDDMAEQIARRVRQRTGVVRGSEQSLDIFLESVARRARNDTRFR
jgi:uncharacterized RDD family membrane protein YckC